MEYKPSDLFIGAIEFFGFLVPGAVLLFLDRDLLLKSLGLNFGLDSLERSAAFLAGSYVIGHFLLGVGVPLNRALEFYRPAARDPFYAEVKESIPLPTARQESRTDAFYRAYSFVRLKSPAALAEIERQMADYKLFRSLTLVFALDLVLILVRSGSGWSRPIFAGVPKVQASSSWTGTSINGWDSPIGRPRKLPITWVCRCEHSNGGRLSASGWTNRWSDRAGLLGGRVRAGSHIRLPSPIRITSDDLPFLVSQRANDLQPHIGG